MTQRNILISMVFLVLWISFLDFPVPMLVDVDTSWQQFFRHAFKQNLQAGIDYAFTYGPLTYFFLKNPPYDSELFLITIIGKSLIYFWFAFIFLMRLIQLSSWKRQLLYLSLLVIILPIFSDVSDPLYLFAIVGTTFLMIRSSSSSKGYLLLLFYCGLLSLVLVSLSKFTFFILTAFCLTGLLIVVWYHESFKKALFLGSCFIFLFLGVWLLCQQSLWNLPSFLSTAWRISSDYSETMSLPVEPGIFGLALSIIAVGVFMIGFNCFNRPWTLIQWVHGSILLCALFLAWKAGFVRYSPYAHVSIFFIFILLLPLLIDTFSPKKVNALLEGLSIFMILVGLSYTVGSYYNYTLSALPEVWYTKIKNNLAVLVSLEQIKNEYDRDMSYLSSEYALPKIQKHVGHATVDMFSRDIGMVFFNRLNYHPRPFFQGYVAYTKDFLHRNASFYAHPQTAPSFVIFGTTPTDIRFPTMEDSQALQVILRDYQPIDYEKDLWLLKRQPRSPSPQHLLLTQQVPLEDKINLQNLSHKTILLSLDIQKSFWGRLMTFFFQLPPIFIEIETTEGTQFACRLVPSLSQANFIINPLLIEPRDWLNWYLGLPLRKVASVRIRTLSRQSLFQPMMNIKVSEEEGLVPYPIEDDLKQTLLQKLRK